LPHRPKIRLLQQLLDAVEDRVIQIVLHGDGLHVVVLCKLLDDLNRSSFFTMRYMALSTPAPEAQDSLRLKPRRVNSR
jgi:hypothetical protein